MSGGDGPEGPGRAEGPEPGTGLDAARPRATVVGPGRIGLTLAEGLHSASTHDAIQVVGRGGGPPAFLAGRPGISYLSPEGWSPPDGSGPLELFFAVPDRALEDAAREWSSRLAAAADPPVRAFHTSGARPADVLDPLREHGARAAVLHPLRAVPAPRAGGLSGAWFGIAGDEDAAARARELAAALGGRTLTIRPGASARYHAAAVLASNLLAGCVLLARGELAGATDASPEEARAAMEDLARSALEALRGEGAEEGLTGPLARGDLETVARNLAALDSPVREAYAGLTRALAARMVGLEPAGRARLEELLGRAGDGATGED